MCGYRDRERFKLFLWILFEVGVDELVNMVGHLVPHIAAEFLCARKASGISAPGGGKKGNIPIAYQGYRLVNFEPNVKRV